MTPKWEWTQGKVRLLFYIQFDRIKRARFYKFLFAYLSEKKSTQGCRPIDCPFRGKLLLEKVFCFRNVKNQGMSNPSIILAPLNPPKLL